MLFVNSISVVYVHVNYLYLIVKCPFTLTPLYLNGYRNTYTLWLITFNVYVRVWHVIPVVHSVCPLSLMYSMRLCSLVRVLYHTEWVGRYTESVICVNYVSWHPRWHALGCNVVFVMDDQFHDMYVTRMLSLSLWPNYTESRQRMSTLTIWYSKYFHQMCYIIFAR